MAKPRLRFAITQVLHRVCTMRQTLPHALDGETQLLSANDRAVCRFLCTGLLREFETYEALLAQLVSRPLPKKHKKLTLLLLSGLYQIRASRIPDHAAVYETVATASTIDCSWAKGLVNAVLHRAIRNDTTEPTVINLPQWLQQVLMRDYPQSWQAIAHTSCSPPPMTLRVNQQQSSRAAYITSHANEQWRLGQYAASAVTLTTPRDVIRCPGFSAGIVSVQDQAGQLLPSLLDLQPGMRVLDACSAPGSKTCHALECVPHCEWLALDSDANRLTRVAENLARLKLSATLQAQDACMLCDWYDGRRFDRIIIDAPCSATGVIRRHPDIKFTRQAHDLTMLTTQQYQLLTSLWPCLKPGGLLIYATCSLLQCENSQVIERFLANQPDARHRPIDAQWGVAQCVGRQILPGDDDMDGFYYAVLYKS